MKRNIIPILLTLAAFILFTIVFTSCGVFYYETPNYTQDSPVYTKWKAEQRAQQEALLKYTQSAEFKRMYGGTSKSNKLDGPAAKSIIGTEYDSFKTIRNTPIDPSLPLPVRVEVRSIKY